MSLIEMIAVIAIIGILSSVSVVGYKSLSKRNRITIATEEIRSALIETQNLAMAPNNPANSKSYGAYFKKSSDDYYIFKDTNNNRNYDSGEEIKKNTLKNYRVKIDKISGNGESNEVSVIFNIPKENNYEIYNKDIFFNPIGTANGKGSVAAGKEGNGSIEILSEDGSQTKTVTINCYSGLISTK